jgi:hypothetical protein
MTKMKTLSAVVILSTIIAAPVFAKDVGAVGRGSRKSLQPQRHVRAHHRRYFRADQRNEHYDPDPYFQRNIDNFGFSGRDPSRIGGEDPSLHPSQY